MLENWELMLMYDDEELNIDDALKIEQTILKDKDLKRTYLLNRHLNSFMRFQSMMEQAINDPELEEIKSSLKMDIAKSVDINDKANNGLKFFINGALQESKIIENQINEAELEMYQRAISSETAQWVEDWVDGNEKLNKDAYSIDIASYIKRGMERSNTPIQLIETKSNKKKWISRISAVAAILVIALGIWRIMPVNNKPADLFSEYYKPYQVIDGQTRNSEKTDDKFFQILKIYKEGNYQTAEIKLREWMVSDARTPKVMLIYGITQVELHKYKDAIACFTEIIAGGSEFSIEAKWYLALCYLKIQDTKKSKELLRELSQTPGIYKEMSIKLLDEL